MLLKLCISKDEGTRMSWTVSLQISTQKKKTGVIAPKRFVQRLKKENELFRSYMHQDAHEFLNFLLNELAENLEKEERVHRESEPSTPSTSEGHADGGYERANGHMNGQPNGVTESAKSGGQSRPTKTWVHDIFQVRGEGHVLSGVRPETEVYKKAFLMMQNVSFSDGAVIDKDFRSIWWRDTLSFCNAFLRKRRS
jgi:hypothetical protein